MILHIFPYEKFTQDYIKRINKLFDSKQHLFWVYGNKIDAAIKEASASNIIFENDVKGNKYLKLYEYANRADKVIVHSLFFGTKKLLFLTILECKNKSKFFWNIWGADLYNEYWDRKKNIKNQFRNFIKKRFIKMLPAVGYINGDYDFLKTHYKTNAKFYIASYSYDFFVPEVKCSDDDEKTINILLGNSATKECRYNEMIDRLSEYKELPIKVKCVLSYPVENKQYVKQVIEHGNKVLKDKFIPLTNFMTYNEYTELLAGIDLAIFNHNRQQALGNIASLLYLGKRVFINPQNACKEYFENMGAIVYSTDDLSEKEICKKENLRMKEINRRAIDEFFSDREFKIHWEKIFKDKY